MDLAEVVPLLGRQRPLDQRQNRFLLVSEVPGQAGGQRVRQGAQPQRIRLRIGQRRVDGVDHRVDGGVFGLHRLQQSQILRAVGQTVAQRRRTALRLRPCGGRVEPF